MPFRLTEAAALKLLLHASRHPTAAVYGVLIGVVNTGSSTVEVLDVLPLFHTQAVVGPCCETALIQAVHLAETNSQQIVGVYEAPQYIKAGQDGPSSTAQAIADRAVRNGQKHCALMVMDNMLFGALMEDNTTLPFRLFEKGNQKWAAAASSESLSCSCPELGNALKRQLEAKVHFELADFDDHLDDIKLDWRNAGLQLV